MLSLTVTAIPPTHLPTQARLPAHSAHHSQVCGQSTCKRPPCNRQPLAAVLGRQMPALAMQGNRDDYEARRLMVRNCQKLNETHLRKLLAFDPRLAVSRTTEMGNLAMDGQTPLHVAAAFGNIPALKILVEKGQDVSLWVRDLQGRTPLHVAAEKGQMETCAYLREAMHAEKHKDPVGEDAPTDLAVRFIRYFRDIFVCIGFSLCGCAHLMMF